MYEELGIASYILGLWEQEREENKSSKYLHFEFSLEKILSSDSNLLLMLGVEMDFLLIFLQT